MSRIRESFKDGKFITKEKDRWGDVETTEVSIEEYINGKINFSAIQKDIDKEIDSMRKDIYDMTAMYDTIVDGANKLKDYRKFLKDQGMTRVKAVFAIFSDGVDNVSRNDFSSAKREIESLNKEEITTAFISFGGHATQVAKDLGFRNILDVASSASELRKAFNCLSKSVIESSKSVLSDDGDDFFQV